MLAPLPVNPLDWPDIWHQANGWRGRFIEEYACGERVVSNALLRLAAVPGRGAEILLPHPVGQRFCALAKAVGPGGPFAQEGKGVAAALAEWTEFAPLRTMLCHGSAAISVDHKGRWYAHFSMIDMRPDRVVEERLTVDEKDAADRLKALHIVRQRLDGRWRAMERRLEGEPEA